MEALFHFITILGLTYLELKDTQHRRTSKSWPTKEYQGVDGGK